MKEGTTEQKLTVVHPEMDSYMASLAEGAAFPQTDGTVAEMEALAGQRDFPIIGRLAGRFLFQQTLLLGARSVFEMGSGFGYSAYWFAKAVGSGGTVVCTDRSEENSTLARSFMEKCGFTDRTVLRTGDAVAIMDEADGVFDIVFTDIDKRRYPEAFLSARGKIRPGGLYIVDNAFWDGRAANPSGDPDSEGVAEFNKAVMSDPDFLTVQVPIRDGVSVSLKLR
ncbi:MAG: O-methyltransferase [Thermodesulfobacteriota bacterium]